MIRPMETRLLRKYAVLFSICMLTYLLSTTVSAQEAEIQAVEASEYTIYLDGKPVVFENSPLLVDNHMLVEFRTMFDSWGYEIGWNAETKTAIGTKDGLHIEIPVGKAEAIVNGEYKALPVATRIVNGRTMIPLKFLAEESGYVVEWDAKAKEIHLTRDLSEQISLSSNVTLNGYIEVSGTVSKQVKHVRLDISHTDKPNEVENVFLTPQNQVIQQSVLLPGGPGIYSVVVLVTTSEDKYESYRLHDTYKVAYAETTELLILPDNEDRNRYTIRGRLSEQAESALLKIKKLDREAFMVLPLENTGSPLIEQEVYLAFGSGVYQVELIEFYDGNQSISTVTVTHKGNAEVQLAATRTNNSQVQISGNVSPDMRWMWVQYANASEDRIRNAFVPVKDGKLDHKLHLNMGKGSYQITIGFTDQETYNQGYTTYERFAVENLDTRDRHRLPSETVQSHAEPVIAKANDITAGLESEMEKSKAIYSWISDHIEHMPHSGGADQIQTATIVLEQGEAGSQGMARLNAAMHRAIGIPAKVVSGEANVGDEWHQHYWTEVFVGGRWVVQDASWDSLMESHEENHERGSEAKESFFDPDEQRFKKDHKKAMDLLE